MTSTTVPRNWLRTLMADAQPNPAHLAIARLQALLPQLTLITQNIDGLHQRAGSSGVLELHGNLGRNKCLSCGMPADTRPDAIM